jgi:hypothetical protein
MRASALRGTRPMPPQFNSGPPGRSWRSPFTNTAETILRRLTRSRRSKGRGGRRTLASTYTTTSEGSQAGLLIASYITCPVDNTREPGPLRVAIAPNLSNGYAYPRRSYFGGE